MEPRTHDEIVRRVKERKLDFDLDGDGLTVRQELNYGLNPYAADSDGDGDNIADGREVNQGSKPGISDLNTSRQEMLAQAEAKNRQLELERQRELTEQRLRELEEERELQKEQLRERYLDRACELLCWPRLQMDYPTLYGDVAGDETIGRALDRMVFQSEVKSGTPPVQAAYLLAQSPWLQWQRERGAIAPEQMRDYASNLLSEYQSQQQPIKEVQEDEEEELGF